MGITKFASRGRGHSLWRKLVMKVLLITDNPSLSSGLARVGRAIASVLHGKYEFVYLGLHSSDAREFAYTEKQGKVIGYNQPDYGKNYLLNASFDLVLTVGDPFHFDYIPSLPNRKKFTWISYVTIDSVNQLGKLPMSWQQSLSNPDLLTTTSKFGQEAITEFLDITAPLYLPLGVDDTFYRLTDKKRKQLRKAQNLDDYFVVLSVNRNSFRKQLPIILKVALNLSNHQIEGYSEGFKFLLSCNSDDAYGYNLRQLIQDYNLENIMLIEKTKHPDEDLNQLYNMADIFVTSSGGEGFGLTILEAMKCGLPIIGANYSSIPELVNEEGQICGTLITPSGYWTTEQGTELAYLSPEAIVEAIIGLASEGQKYSQYSAQAIKNAQKYSWNILQDGIIEAIDMVEKKRSKSPKEQGNILEIVDLIIPKGVQWRDFTYAKVDRVFNNEPEHWKSQWLNDIIEYSDKEWIALVAPDVQVQRGWLCELLKLRNEETAVVVSTCLDLKGKIAEGEMRCGANLFFFPEEGLPPGKQDKQIGAASFSCILINKTIFQKLGGFKENLVKSYFDIEYCLRANSERYKIIQSAKSIVLKTAPSVFDEKDGAEFKLETEIRLNTDVAVQYQGTRPKIKTIYGDLSKEPVRFPFRMALDLVCSYKSISFVDVKHDVNVLSYLIDSGGRVLIARNMGLGDVLSALYFGARPLKLANDEIHLTACVNKPYLDLVKHLPFIDDVLPYPEGLSMAKEYDYFKDLSYIPESIDRRSAKSRPDIFARAALQESRYFNFAYDTFQVPDEYCQKAKAKFAQLGIGKGRKAVGIQTTCDSVIRAYAPEYLSELIVLLAKDFDVVLFGQDKSWHWGLERWNGEHLFSFVNQTDSIMDAAALMARCDYGIAPDSGLMHLWAFMKKPTLALFGNIDPKSRCKYYSTVTALYPEGEIDCIPCGDMQNPCPQNSDLGTKGAFAGRCMRRLYPERVYLKFLEMINYQAKEKVVSIPKCPICGEKNFEIINEIDYWDKGNIPQITFVQCKNDGLVFSCGDIEVIQYETEYFQSGKKDLYYENILTEQHINGQTAIAKRILDEYYQKR